MKQCFLTLLLVGLIWPATAQKFVVDKSSIVFFSDGAIEDITASNKKASSIFNTETTDIVFSIPISEFQFEKSLMQEHFNEKYMESDKYPKSTFQGKVSGFNKDTAGPQTVKATGKLTIHGITRDIEVPGTLEKKGSNLNLQCKFIVKLADYKIEIPQLLWQNIAEQVEVTMDIAYKPQ